MQGVGGVILVESRGVQRDCAAVVVRYRIFTVDLTQKDAIAIWKSDSSVNEYTEYLLNSLLYGSYVIKRLSVPSQHITIHYES